MKTKRVWTLAAGMAVLLAGLAPSASAVNATGGTITESDGYKVHTFTNDGAFTVTSGGAVDVLVVAGGGGGGGGTGGGGGAGGLIYANGFTVDDTSSYTVTVGGGGAGGSGTAQNGFNGTNSSFGSLVAFGGGGGGCNSSAGRAGGSGGGGGGGSPGGAATNGQGYAGGSNGVWSANYPMAGGGGAGTNGGNAVGNTTPGAGGDGRSNAISGVWTWYAGGGGGGVYTTVSGAAGGLGGGGHGGTTGGSGTTNGQANTGGGGGGGGGNQSVAAGRGGSGIVIVRYVANAVYTLVPTNVTATSANLNGSLVSTGVSDTAVIVYYGPTDGGTNPDNWAATNLDLIAPQSLGAKTVNVTVPAGGETFYRFAASNAEGLVWAESSQYFISTNVAISVTPATVGEMNGVGTYSFARPEALTNGALTVNFTIGGSAANGLDYSPVSAVSVILPVGVASATLPVTVLPDVKIEGDETVELTETAGAYVMNDPAVTTLTIADSPTLTTLLPSDVTSTSVSLNGYLTSTGNYESAVHVYYGPTDGGNNPANWAETNVSLIGPQSVGSKTVNVAVTPGIQYFYRYAASNVWGITMASNSQYFLTANVEISALPDTIPEVSGVSQFRFVRPATLVNGEVTVNFTLGGTAVGGTDYATITATSVTLAVGATSATVQVSGLVDFITEGGESVVLTQTAGAYPLNSPPTTTLTITDATVPAWTLTTNTVVLQQGANIVLNGMTYGERYTNTVDTYIDQDNPNTSYETASVILSCREVWAGGQTQTKRGYLRFESLQNYVPSNAVIVKAWLDLTSAGIEALGSSGNITYRTADWNPTNTWNTRPANGEQKIGSFIYTGWGYWWAEGVVRGIDISPEAQGWVRGTLPNYGLLFRSDEGGATYEQRSFYSSEEATISRRPKLTIVYALPKAVVSPQGYERYWPIERTVVALSGADIIQDTYVCGDTDDTKTNNYSSATTVNLRTRNALGVRRALLKLNTTSGVLATLTPSTAPTNAMDKRLVKAWLRISIAGSFLEQPSLWTCDQAWDAGTATFNTRDGVNPWNAAWATGGDQNVGSAIGTFSLVNAPLVGCSGMLDITAPLQAWINGTNNYGFVLGHTYADYDNMFALTEYETGELRPTLVMEYYELPKPRGVIMIIR